MSRPLIDEGNQSHDLSGREYAKLSELKAGAIVEIDEGFTCCGGGHTHLYENANKELFFYCEEGLHMLDGQLAEDGDHLVGIYPHD